MVEYILYAIAKFFSVLFTALPVDVALSAGRLFGRIGYYVNFKRARIAYGNLRFAFSSNMEPPQMRQIVKKIYINFGQVFAEILRIPAIDKGYVDRYIKIENIQYIDEVMSRNKGIIFLTGHYGNWELLSITSAIAGYPLMVLAREQKMKRLNGALNAFRESKGCKVIKKGMATREIYDHLSKNGIVGILSDQDSGKKGNFVNFFGRPTSTPRGAFALSRKTGAVIIPAFMIRTKGAYHKLLLDKPIEPPLDEANEVEAMQAFTSELEKNIEKNPDQWLWLHKRWKSTPLRKVVILSDRKKGHLNQSLAVFDRLKELRAFYGYEDKYTELKIIEIDFKSKIKRVLLGGLSRVISGSSKARNFLLRSALHEDSYNDLKRRCADIVISCGSKTEAVNILYSRENNAKNVVIMKPNVVGVKNFTLAIIPEHDNPPSRGNIISTVGNISVLTADKLREDLRAMKGNIGTTEGPNIGLLIGGDNKHYTLDVTLVKKILDGVNDAACKLNANILVTTSRRTSNDVGSLIKKELDSNNLAKLVVIAKEDNPKWTVGGILAASNVVIVSGESSSMISEAVGTGKRVIVFKTKRRSKGNRRIKHEVFVNRLEASGAVKISDEDRLKDEIVSVVNSKHIPKALNNDSEILEGLKTII